MNRIHHAVIRALPLIGALLLANPGESAESKPANPTDSASDTASTPRLISESAVGEQAAPPQRNQCISVRLAAILAARWPQYVPASESPEASSQNDSSTGSGAAVSDDDILHLPKYVVHGPRTPVWRERDISTERGLTKIAMKRYITPLDRALNQYRIPIFGISCEARALAMYAEDERLQNMADLDRTARNAALVDRVAGAEIRRLSAATYHRSRN